MSAAHPAPIPGRWCRATAYEFSDRALRGELDRTLTSLAQWRSLAEGSAMLTQAVDELWLAVKGGQIGLARRHALVAAAWAVRVHAELCDRGGDRAQRCAASLAAAKAIRAQLTPARVFASSHEAYGFLRCAMGRFWSAVQVDDRSEVNDQLLIIAAVASRFAAEIHGTSPRSKASA
ncbi:hypothetical protein [Mycobacteroides abscessus]|uniref:hypothetical protein n=1 Tax=Mycobacteroides abscessus TaxID=36809 RepID=UPI0009A89B53|nr:hypothetical protein [Mycobacteroides abscessus]